MPTHFPRLALAGVKVYGNPTPNPQLPQYFGNDHPPFTNINVTKVPQPSSLILRSSPFKSHCLQIPNLFSGRNKDPSHVSVLFYWPLELVPLLGRFAAPCRLALAIFTHSLAKSPSLHRWRRSAHFQLPSFGAERDKKNDVHQTPQILEFGIG